MAATVAARTAAARRSHSARVRGAPTRQRQPARSRPARTRTSNARHRAATNAKRRGRATFAPRLPGPMAPVAAVGRTALRARALPDSGLVLRMSQGRLWIGVLGVLLAGIVALNVGSLSLSSGSSHALQRAQQLKRESSELRSKLARRLSADQLERAAGKIGMVVPDPGTIRYLTAARGDAGHAAKRLLAGLPATPAPAASPIPATPTPASTPPVAQLPTTPAAPTQPATAPLAQAPPAAGAPAQTAPASTAAPPPPAGGVQATATAGQP